VDASLSLSENSRGKPLRLQLTLASGSAFAQVHVSLQGMRLHASGCTREKFSLILPKALLTEKSLTLQLWSGALRIEKLYIRPVFALSTKVALNDFRPLVVEIIQVQVQQGFCINKQER
jgi:hypothetical protein